jgi:hypothetical protein
MKYKINTTVKSLKHPVRKSGRFVTKELLSWKQLVVH